VGVRSYPAYKGIVGMHAAILWFTEVLCARMYLISWTFKFLLCTRRWWEMIQTFCCLYEDLTSETG